MPGDTPGRTRVHTGSMPGQLLPRLLPSSLLTRLHIGAHYAGLPDTKPAKRRANHRYGMEIFTAGAFRTNYLS